MSNPTDPSVVPTVSASQKAEFHRKKATAAGAARTLEAVAEGSAKPVAMAKGAMETAAELGKVSLLSLCLSCIMALRETGSLAG